MKKRIFFVMAFALIFAANAHAVKRGGGGGGVKSDSGSMSVQVREVIVRATPNYMGPQVGTLHYGDTVNIQSGEGNWYQIESPRGYLPKSAASKSKVAVNPDAKFSGRGAKHDEVALAGKGFNPQIEGKYKQQHPELVSAFAQIDKMETYTIPDAVLKQFQASGKLSPR